MADCDSRPEPHKQLKKFLSPAFTVGYTDKLDVLFAECINALMKKYDTALEVSVPATADIMEDLHNVALDM